jgi:hypothetical protein
MKKFKLAFVVVLVLGLASPALGAEVTFHGDLNNRFMVYTDQASLFKGAGYSSNATSGTITEGGVSDSWGEAKYRLWTEFSTNDGNVKGVYAIELGTLRYGKSGSLGKSTGGAYSGDAVNIETRWAYTDFQLPMVESKARFRLGLQPIKVNHYLWQETAMGVNFNGGDSTNYQLAWLRGYEVFQTDATAGDHVNHFLGRVNFKPSDGLKIGVFGLYNDGGANATGTNGSITAHRYQRKFIADDVNFSTWDIGVDGSFKAGSFFLNWDLIFQGGDLDNVDFTGSDGVVYSNAAVDMSAYFGHVDVGYKMGDATLVYTFWYASGDDDPSDADFEGYMSADVDSFDGIVLFEGFTDDNYFSERHYLLDKGFIMNKLALHYKATDKLKLGAALLYMQTAEDIKYTASANSKVVAETDVGLEVDLYLKYMLYKNVEFAINFGYLSAGDAMDYWEEASIQDGSSDEDIIKSGARIRYKF